MTVREHKGALEGLKMAYIGDGNNMANSPDRRLPEGRHGRFHRLPGRLPAGSRGAGVCEGLRRQVHSDGRLRGGGQRRGRDLYRRWASMGQEGEAEKRRIAFAGYQVNAELLAAARPDCMVQHCLPAHRGEEITADVFGSPCGRNLRRGGEPPPRPEGGHGHPDEVTAFRRSAFKTGLRKWTSAGRFFHVDGKTGE